MPASASMTVKNTGQNEVNLSVGRSNCMASGFDEFAGPLAPGAEIATEIVVNDGGSCAFESSWFDIAVDPGGGFSISESNGSWSSYDVAPAFEIIIDGGSIEVLIA